MILKQYYLGCLAHGSYLVADQASATAIIIDPQRDIQKYLDDAENFGLRIRQQDLEKGFQSLFHLIDQELLERPRILHQARDVDCCCVFHS